MKKDDLPISIENELHLKYLIERTNSKPAFAFAFEFADEELFNNYLASLGVDIDAFNKKHYYVNKVKDIHISQSEEGYIWISTMGLVAKSRSTGNKYINSCSAQKTVLMHLLDDAITLSNDERSYDIDGYQYSMIEELTLALFHNTIFYFEILSKAYLSVNGADVPKTHKLEKLLPLVKETMFRKRQNNTLFHAYTIPAFQGMVDHIESIPGTFKEQYVKYDDNEEDSTIIAFDATHLTEVRNLVEVTHDMVTQMYYDGANCLYLGSGLYQRLQEKCKTAEEIDNIKAVYGFLLDEES